MTFSNYLQASDPNKNIWVSASAGSGKTKLLVDRVLRLLMSGAKPQNILCVTFTKAAAAEMFERIKTELKNWFLASEKTLCQCLESLAITPGKNNLLKARSLIFEIIDKEQAIQIATIHSLCQDILNKFPLEAGIGIFNKVIDENERQIAIKQAKHKFLNKNFDDSKYLNILFQNISEQTLGKFIDTSLSFDNNSFEWGSLEKNFSDFEQAIDRFYRSESWRHIEHSILEIKKLLIDLLAHNKNILQEVKVLAQLAPFRNDLSVSEDNIDETSKILEAIQNIFFTKENTPRAKLLDKKEQNNFPNLENELLQIQNKLLHFFENKTSYLLASLSKALAELKLYFAQNYNEIKQEQASIDFNDIIIKTFELLSNDEIRDWIRYKLGYQIKHILVDESQDTNILQWKVISSISEEFPMQEDSSFFIVGDDKQSIYSFQGASPIIFDTIEKMYHGQTANSLKPLQKIYLDYSFRSGQLLLDFVDKVFKGTSRPITDSYREHKSQSHQRLSKVELFPIITIPTISRDKQKTWCIPKERTLPYNPARKNATLIAIKINRLIAEGYRPKDIMVLVRKRDNFTKYILSEIKKLEIPISGLDKMFLTDQLAIQDLIAFGEFLLYPYDDLNLASLLKSPIFSINEDELFALCHSRQNSIWDEIRNSTESKFQKIFRILDYYLNYPSNNIYKLYDDLLTGHLLKNSFIERFGDEVEEILDEFLNICERYQDDCYRSLELFIDWIKKSKIEIKRSFNTQQNEVKLLTIHGAKGLQSKIVILADAVSAPNFSDNIFWDDIENIPLFNGNSSNQNKKYTKKKEEYTNKIIDEYFRLLYVALTRAEEQIIIFGYSNSSKKINENSWYKYIEKAAQSINSGEKLSNIFGFYISNEKPGSNYIAVASPVKYVISNDLNTNPVTKQDIEIYEEKKPCLTITPKDFKPETINPLNTQEYDYIVTQKGKLFHKLLEILVTTGDKKSKQNYKSLVDKFSKFYNVLLSAQEVNLLDKFYQHITSFIKKNSILKKEQEFVFNVEGEYRKGIIDLMIIAEKQIILIDYKNARHNPEDRKKYTEQLSFYHSAISTIYPGYKIKAYIGWIKELSLDLVIS